MNDNFSRSTTTFIDLHSGILVAHPAIKDKNFSKSVILVTQHPNIEGRIGIVLNRPLNQTLADYKSEFTYSLLSKVPVFWGGPVEPKQMVLVAWSFSRILNRGQMYFGITPEKAEELISMNEGFEVRCFVGVCGWAKNQLEHELQQSTWVHMPIFDDLPDVVDKQADLWAYLLGITSSELFLLSLAPENPLLN